MLNYQKTQILLKKTIQIIKNNKIESLEICLEKRLSIKTTCVLTASFAQENVIQIVNPDFFSCFCRLREKTPDIIYLCKGAKKNVYPSSMGKDMGKGLLAYQLTMGKKTSNDNLVNIFDFDDIDIVTPKEQQEFYNKWLKSIK